MSLRSLAATIEARKGADPDSSWTAKLLAKGPEKAAQKFGEEAIEAIVEAIKGDRTRLISEAADTLYHLLVMCAARDVTLADIEAELERREGRSGLDEKAARRQRPAIFLTQFGRRLWYGPLRQTRPSMLRSVLPDS